jgi:hypothetical protein
MPERQQHLHSLMGLVGKREMQAGIRVAPLPWSYLS